MVDAPGGASDDVVHARVGAQHARRRQPRLRVQRTGGGVGERVSGRRRAGCLPGGPPPPLPLLLLLLRLLLLPSTTVLLLLLLAGT